MANPKKIDTIIKTPHYAILLIKKDNLTLPVKIDINDVDRVSKFHWIAYKHHSGKYYYIRNSKGLALHRYIMNTPKELAVDHINRDTLDNRKCNLRNVTVLENNNNRGRYANVNAEIGIQGISVLYRVRISGFKPKYFNSKDRAIEYYNNCTKEKLNVPTKRN